jgi:uncharacterized protein (TIGR02246 family)
VTEDGASFDLVEIVRRCNDAYNRRDFDACLSLFSPDVVFCPVSGSPESQEQRGRDKVRRYHEEFLEAWADDFVANFDTVRVYDDVVVARNMFTGHARTSGVEISGRTFEVFFIQDGLITRWEAFTNRADALTAAGVSA